MDGLTKLDRDKFILLDTQCALKKILLAIKNENGREEAIKLIFQALGLLNGLTRDSDSCFSLSEADIQNGACILNRSIKPNVENSIQPLECGHYDHVEENLSFAIKRLDALAK